MNATNGFDRKTRFLWQLLFLQYPDNLRFTQWFLDNVCAFTIKIADPNTIGIR